MKNPSLTPAPVHKLIQIFFALFLLYVGWEFYNYYLWASGASQAFSPRPPAVEAFLPISALLGVKRLLLGGGFDPIHPAGLWIFLAAVGIALFARKGFCGYLCPIGFGCAQLGRLGGRLGLSRRPGPLVSRLISLPKYLLLVLLLWPILTKMGLQDLEWFMNSPFNKIADTHTMLFFLEPSRNALIALAVILAGSLAVPGFWCRGFCPYGALLGLFSFFSPLAVRRDKSKCSYCRRCLRACPVRIRVYEKTRVKSPECQGCLECVSACPEQGCLGVTAGYGRAAAKAPFWVIPALTLLILLGVYAAARLNGLWESRVNPMELKMHHLTMLMQKGELPPGLEMPPRSIRPGRMPDGRTNAGQARAGLMRSGRSGPEPGQTGQTGQGQAQSGQLPPGHIPLDRIPGSGSSAGQTRPGNLQPGRTPPGTAPELRGRPAELRSPHPLPHRNLEAKNDRKPESEAELPEAPPQAAPEQATPGRTGS